MIEEVQSNLDLVLGSDKVELADTVMPHLAAAVPDQNLLSLIFSAPGAAIAICLTIVAVALVIFFLSSRYPFISLQYKDSKLELKRQELATQSKSEGATANPAEKPVALDAPDDGALLKKDSELSNGFGLHEMLEAVEKQDFDRINTIFDHFKTHPPFAKGVPYELEVWRNAQLLRAGYSGALATLQQIEHESPKETDASEVLAYHYLHMGAHELAAKHTDIMFNRASNDNQIRDSVLLKAHLLDKMQGYNAAANFLNQQVTRLPSSEHQSRIYAKLGETHSKNKHSVLAIAAYEQALKRDVHNKDARFQLAYLYGEIDALQTLAVRHYRILIQQDRRYWNAQNNLGVQYEKLGLQTHKIAVWRGALERAESFPLGNIMLAYLESGFVAEARKLYDEAPSYAKSGKRVAYAHDRLQRIEEEEREKLENFQTDAEKIWLGLTRIDFALELVGTDWIGEWREENGSSSLRIAKSGEFVEVEQFDGPKARKGVLRALGTVALVSVSERDMDPRQSLSLLSLAGPYESGHFFIGQTVRGIRILHIADKKLRTERDYVRSEPKQA